MPQVGSNQIQPNAASWGVAAILLCFRLGFNFGSAGSSINAPPLPAAAQQDGWWNVDHERVKVRLSWPPLPREWVAHIQHVHVRVAAVVLALGTWLASTAELMHMLSTCPRHGRLILPLQDPL